MANTNLECAASGRPVITSNIHGCKEAVIDGVSGILTKEKDAENLYYAMKKFCALSYEKRKQMGIEGRKHMEKNFDKKMVVTTTIEAMRL
jgi:glycosyltransferase involved in cell wall biosynthesis